MPQKFLVRASLLPGQPFYCRAGRGWGSDPKTIEVIDQDDCPLVDNRVHGLPKVPHPTLVGRKAFDILLKDARISVKPEGADSSEAMASQVPGLQAKLSAETGKVAELEGKIKLISAEADVLGAKINTITAERDAHAKSSEALSVQVAGLQGRLADSEKEKASLIEKNATLEALLGDATKPTEVGAEATKPTDVEGGKKTKNK
jgi:hypothetical protein